VLLYHQKHVLLRYLDTSNIVPLPALPLLLLLLL
jgi:hypothetical protein